MRTDHPRARHTHDRQLQHYLADQREHADGRRSKYATITSSYYDLATDFYEYGWGSSFHFAPRWKAETLRESLLRHECWLAHKLNLSPGQAVLDLGCGIGGPMRTIAGFSGARIQGININAYQVRRARELNARHGVRGCEVLEADFMSLPLPDAAADAAYAIEATVHAPDPTACCAEIRRVLKAGGLFGSYEWCMTPRFNADDPSHSSIKRQIEIGCGIADIPTTTRVLAAVEKAGLQLLQHEDLALSGDVPWWQPLAPSGFSFTAFRASPAGAMVTQSALALLEFLRIAPKGSLKTCRMLAQGAEALVAGGRAGIFTPALFILARRP